MRRPAPIPTPAPERPDDAAARADRSAPDTARREPTPPVPLQPVTKDPPPGTDARAAAARETLPSPAAPTVDAPADDIGLRDVWRAARARRKALRAEMRRFTQRRRRRRAAWLVAAASVVVLVAVTVGAAYSPLFAVQRIEVVGTSQLDPAAVEQALAGEIGTPLASVDGSAVKAALIAFPLVESYALEARPPHDLVVRIVERTPVGAIPSRGGWTVVDAAGVVLSTSTGAPAGQPELDITGGLSSSAFTAAATVMRALPDAIRSQVTAVTATTADDVTLTLGSRGVQVVWGGTTDSARKAVVLQQAMAAFPIGTVSSYDISSPEAIVVR